MNTIPSNNQGQEMLSFSPFVSNAGEGGGNASNLKTNVMRVLSGNGPQLTPSSPSDSPDAASQSIFNTPVVSKHSVDVYGRPRTLTGWEVTLQVLAWPTVIGVALGFGLAISLLAIHTPSSLNPSQKPSLPQVTSLEAAP
jgi:hypothetical protein